jgi:16S rRNA (cytidine1402-2'-O)-methyltransferase
MGMKEQRQDAQLYIVPTPIGNLADITLRAITVLKDVDLILAEDTRTTGKLLQHYDISTKQRSFHIHNEHKIVAAVIQDLLAGTRIALVSDAGTPGISDPGYLLVRAALENNIRMESLPGATAFVPALVNSGFPTDRFCFEGFLPHKKGRKTRIESLGQEERTIVLYESPHRLMKLLDQLEEVLGLERRISVSRELTKLHEETITGHIPEVKKHFAQKAIKGEIVVVIDAK